MYVIKSSLGLFAAAAWSYWSLGGVGFEINL